MTKVRIARKQGKRAKKKGAGGLVGALGLFIVICGVLLLVVGTQSSSCGGPDEEATRRAAAQKVLNALTETHKADQALESKNYGKARAHVKQLQLELTSALNDIRVE